MDYETKKHWIALAIQSTGEKSPLAVYMYLAGLTATKMNSEPGMGITRTKRLMAGIRPTDEEIDILSDILELEPLDVKRLTYSRPSPKEFELKHQYMLSPKGVPFIVSDNRSNREMEGWVYTTCKNANGLLRQKKVTPQLLKIVTQNPATQQAMLKNGTTTDPMFGWNVYGVK